MRVSIVIPTLNEAAQIGATLESLLVCAAAIEPRPQILVVDGGSQDSTAEIVAGFRGVTWINAARGRGSQLAVGAAAADGDVFWFLHADTRPPADAIAVMREALLADPRLAAGNFALAFDGHSGGARFLTRCYPWLRLLGLCYGDSGLFVRREAYQRAGGFRALPLFEDLDLLKRLKRLGGFAHMRTPLVTSSRRWEGRSFALVFARWTALQVAYWVGVNPVRLAQFYRAVR